VYYTFHPLTHLAREFAIKSYRFRYRYNNLIRAQFSSKRGKKSSFLGASILPILDMADHEELQEGESVTVHLLAGAAAGTAEHCAMFPVDTIKVVILFVEIIYNLQDEYASSETYSHHWRFRSLEHY
jgi:hypothetical protein